MPLSELRWIRRCAEYRPRSDASRIPKKRRGIYVLFRHLQAKEYEVVYVGMAAKPNAGMRGRVQSHARKMKETAWSHFSVFEVWENISEQEVHELEGLLRHIFRRDPAALPGNRQRAFKPLIRVRRNSFRAWN